MAEYQLRPATRADDQSLVDLWNSFETVSELTIEEFAYWMYDRKRPEGARPEVKVAADGEEVVGYLFLEQSVHTKEPGVYFAEVAAHKSRWGQGIGSLLWRELERLAGERGVRKLYLRAAEDIAESNRFLLNRGAVKTGRGDRLSRLDVANANLEGYENIESRLASETGIVIKAFSELQPDDAFMRQLHAMHTAAVRDIPSSEEYTGTPFETWMANFLKGPGCRPEAYFIALDGNRPVGEALLILHGDDSSFNGFTGTDPEYRGKGIARALKLRTIEWSRQNGVKTIETGNDVDNGRMLAINVRLGYQPLPVREEYLKSYER